MRSLACLAVLLAPCLDVAAAGIPLQNPSFTQWLDRQPDPHGWSVVGPDAYAVDKECAVRSPEAGCALRIHGTEGRGQKAIRQSVHPGNALGHGAVLSGRVRTRDVQGRAALWMQVDGPDGTKLEFDLQELRGTRDWETLEIRLPVAPNAREIVVGVLMQGTGTAWFTDLRLEGDPSVDASKRPPPQPPRTPPPATLLDDATLYLPAANIPRINPAWKADVAAHARPIRSLVSDDFSDLAFLEPLLRGRRVVQLGESSHGIAEFNWIKARLVRYLHERLGYDVLAFESSVSGCEVANRRLGSAPADAVMRDCTFGVWHTEEVVPLFEYLKATQATPRPMRLAGFDVQDTGAAAWDVDALLVAAARRTGDDAVTARVQEANRILRSTPSTAGYAEAESAYGDLARRLKREDPMQRAARARVLYARKLQLGDPMKGQVRDRGMADLLDELLDEVYPGRKVIVWAHNLHVAKSATDGQRMMGSWVNERRGREVYTIGVYMGRGTGAMNDRKTYEIAPPPSGSLEAVMTNAGWTMSFVDLAGANEGGWADMKLVAREFGRGSAQLVPRQAYDAILYIDTVTPPRYR